MKTARISRGGQIQIPAEVRRRWGTVNVIVEDLGDEVSVRPLPDDPIAAALAPIKASMTADEFLALTREEEAEAEERKWGDSARRVGTDWRFGERTGKG